MSKLVVVGGKKLHGEINIHGAKNSVLPLLAATYLCNGTTYLHKVPDLSDVTVSIDILKHLGCKCKREGDTVTIDASSGVGSDIPEALMREMRSSIVFMGAVAAKTGKATLSMPGGCELGPRPIDIHISALEQLGAKVECDCGILSCEFPEGVKSADIHLKFPSVGATENAVLSACLANGEVVIRNAAKEPEIVDLALFLNKSGAKIYGAGTDTIRIVGVKSLFGAEYSVMPDRIIAATVMFAVASTGGKVLLENAVFEHIIPIVTVLKDCGCEIQQFDCGLEIAAHGRISNFDTVTTQPYPGFPTDAGPLAVAMSTTAKGTGVFVENIFDNRFRYIDELKRLGASIKTVGRVAIIRGVKHLSGAEVISHDLRGGAALTVAGLTANGKTVINNTEYIDRGYEKIENIFSSLGADIKRL